MNPKTTLTPNAPWSKLWRSFLSLLIVLALTGLGTKLHAQGHQTDTWNGGGANGMWTNAANWSQPVSLLGDDLVFQGTTKTANSNNFTGLGISSITINNTNFTISGNALTITNGITDNAGSNTISIPLTLGAPQTFRNNAPLTPTNITTISGTIALGTNNLTLSGSGNLFLTAAISSTSTTNGGSITINNSGVARFGTTGSTFGSNVLDAVIVNSGELQINNGSSVPSGPSIGNVLDNGMIDLNGFSPTFNGLEGGGFVDNLPTNLTAVYTLSVGAGNSNAVWSGSINDTVGSIALTKVGFGTQTLAGPNGYSGLTQVSQGTLAVAPGGSLGSRSLSMIISPGAILDVSALGIIGYNPQGIFNLNAGTPTKPYTNYLGSYATNYPNFVTTTNITLTATNITTNSIVSVINYDVNGNFFLFGGSFTPVAPSPGYATFTVNGNLTLDNSQGGVNNLFFLLNSVTNVGGGLNDLIQITNGTMNIGDTVNFVISPANGSLATGKYTLIQSPSLSLAR
jgi:autotransporter-associated beta strand protein